MPKRIGVRRSSGPEQVADTRERVLEVSGCGVRDEIDERGTGQIGGRVDIHCE